MKITLNKHFYLCHHMQPTVLQTCWTTDSKIFVQHARRKTGFASQLRSGILQNYNVYYRIFLNSKSFWIQMEHEILSPVNQDDPPWDSCHQNQQPFYPGLYIWQLSTHLPYISKSKQRMSEQSNMFGYFVWKHFLVPKWQRSSYCVCFGINPH